MNSPCSIEARLTKTSPLPFAVALARQFQLYFDLTFDAREELKETDTLVFTFRDLFSDADPPHDVCVYRQPLGQALPAGEQRAVPVTITNDDAPLPPSSYHVRVDVTRDDRSLCGARVGSTRIYLMKDNESPHHVAASYILSRTEFSWNRRDRVYFVGAAVALPPTLDPFCDGSFADYVKATGMLTGMQAESIQGGGIGLLHGAKLFRALGEIDRARFCERTLRRSFEDMVFGRMIDDDGGVRGLDTFENHHAPLHENRAETAFVLKCIAQAILYFHEEAREPEYAASLLDRAAIIADNHFGRPMEFGCGCPGDPSICTCYDGRIIQGACEWLNAVVAIKGVCDRKQLGKATQFAFAASKRVMANGGWFDAQCLGEEHCHIICGNHNLIGGLLATLRLIDRYDDNVPGYGQPYYFSSVNDARNQIIAGIQSAFEFIAGKQVSLTGKPLQFYPGYWGLGHLYQECLELVDLPETRAHARRWLHLMRFIASSFDISDKITAHYELSAVAALLGMSPEVMERLGREG